MSTAAFDPSERASAAPSAWLRISRSLAAPAAVRISNTGVAAPRKPLMWQIARRRVPLATPNGMTPSE